jgi:hypothetical protein
VIKSRRIRWVGYEACIGEMVNACKILVKGPEGKKLHGGGGLGIDGRVVLRASV